MRTIKWVTGLYLVLFSAAASAWTANDLNKLTADFITAMPADLQATKQGWTFFTLEDCFARPDSQCWGANPSSPYGQPLFNGRNNTQVRPDEAIVFLLRTPPRMRYFSLIPYLHTRTDNGIESTLFASVDAPLNHLKIVTAASPVPGDNVFNQLSVVVMTPAEDVFQRIKTLFMDIGFPDTAVNKLALSPAVLKLDGNADDDSVTLLFRVALPENEPAFQKYIDKDNSPVRVFRITPVNQQDAVAVDKPHRPRPDRDPEPEYLLEHMKLLIADIKANYATTVFSDHGSLPWAPIGELCILTNTVCGGDNYDAVYTIESKNLINDKGANNFTLVVGVNHRQLGNAVYINHTISDPDKQAGVASFTDRDISGSVAYHAGITDPDDPRLEQYRDFYVYAIAPDCTGMQFCLEVPLPGDHGGIGISSGDNYDIIGRVYLDPVSKVRPRAADLVLPVVLQASH